MATIPSRTIQKSDEQRPLLVSYVSGFVLSIALTIAAYVATTQHSFSHNPLMALIAGLAVVQLFVQLGCFLHLGRGSSRRWNALVLLFAALVVSVVVFGSLWIMHNLNYRMSGSPREVDKYLQNQDSL